MERVSEKDHSDRAASHSRRGILRRLIGHGAFAALEIAKELDEKRDDVGVRGLRPLHLSKIFNDGGCARTVLQRYTGTRRCSTW